MGDRWDALRSAVERAATSVKERAQETAERSTFAKVRKAVRETMERKARLPLSHLRRLVMNVPGVRAGSVAIVAREGVRALAVDLELEEGKTVRAELVPAGIHFAPRGSKELSFRVTPAEASYEPAIKELVGALAAFIARTLWSASLPPATGPHESGLVDREGDVLRIDLRTLGAVRSAMARGPAVALLLDVIAPEALEIDDDALVLRIGLPPLRP